MTIATSLPQTDRELLAEALGLDPESENLLALAAAALSDRNARLWMATQLLGQLASALGCQLGATGPASVLETARRLRVGVESARPALEMARQYLSDVGQHSPAPLGCEAAVDAVLVDALAQLGSEPADVLQVA